MSEAQRVVRGSIWPQIEPYAMLRMSAAEIAIARKLDVGEELDATKVDNTLKMAFQSPYINLPRRTELEKKDSRTRAVRESPQEKTERVGLWLDAAAFLITDPWNSYWPITRLEWMDVVAELRQEGVIGPEGRRWSSLRELFGKHNQPLDLSDFRGLRRFMRKVMLDAPAA